MVVDRMGSLQRGIANSQAAAREKINKELEKRKNQVANKDVSAFGTGQGG